MDLGSVFGLSPTGDVPSFCVLHKIKSTIAFILFLFITCFIITLLCMLVLHAAFEFMFKIEEWLYGRHGNEEDEIMDFEQGENEIERQQFVSIFNNPRTQGEGKERRMQIGIIDKLLTTVEFDEDEANLVAGDNCSICLDDYENGELCKMLPACKHMFHSDCIKPWLKKNLTCPVCRNLISDL